jgi:hypothetical protein
MADQTDQTAVCENPPPSPNWVYPRGDIGTLYDRMTRLEVHRENDARAFATLKQEIQVQLMGIETKLDSLLESASQRRGLEKFMAIVWDVIKLGVAASIGMAASRIMGH